MAKTRASSYFKECNYCQKEKKVTYIHFEAKYTTGEIAMNPLDFYLCADCITIWEGWGCKFTQNNEKL